MGLGCRDQAEYSSRGANILWAWGLPTHRGLLVPAELGAEQNEKGGLLAPGAAVVLHNHLRRVSRNQKVLVFPAPFPPPPSLPFLPPSVSGPWSKAKTAEAGVSKEQ